MPSFAGRSRGRSFGASRGHDPKYLRESMERAALSKGFSTISEYFDYLHKNNPNSCKAAAQLYQECISDYGKNSSNCDFYYKKLSSCPDFEKGKYLDYLQTSDSKKSYVKSLRESYQKKAVAKGFSTIQEYFDDMDRKNPNKCRIISRIYKECTSNCDVYREKLSFLSCPGFKKDTDSMKSS